MESVDHAYANVQICLYVFFGIMYIYMCIYIYIYLYIFNYIYISIYIFTFAPGTCTNALMGEGPWISIITRIQTPGAPEFVQSERKACC